MDYNWYRGYNFFVPSMLLTIWSCAWRNFIFCLSTALFFVLRLVFFAVTIRQTEDSIMIRINNIHAGLEVTPPELKALVAAKLGVSARAIISLQVVKKAVDARSKSKLHLVLAVEATVQNEDSLKWSDKDIERVMPEERLTIPDCSKCSERPVVVGSGPAGMMAGLVLAEAGLRPIVLERGRPVEERLQDVDLFWKTGHLKPESNVQFGEGGAGTFSDGKLMTGIKKDCYVHKVFEAFVAAGAPADILYLAKPHIGTDKLAVMVPNMRRRIEALGGEYRFGHKLQGLKIKDGKLIGIEVAINGGEEKLEMACSRLVLAIGHSARDTFEMLNAAGVAMEAKPFSVGVRIEHKQKMIDEAQYGSWAGHQALGAADYKLAVHLPNGRSVYTFCMCPGGEVVAAASEEGRVVTNGMSCYARNKPNANAALLVGVTPKDYASPHPLAGMYFQRKFEEAAFRLGGGDYKAPAQTVGDFLRGRASVKFGAVRPSYTPGVRPANLHKIMPKYMSESLGAALVEMNKKLRGFASFDAVLTGMETRSSSPIRIVRGADLMSVSVEGLYPCGEGAGYAGGITSAAADGVKTAMAICDAIK